MKTFTNKRLLIIVSAAMLAVGLGCQTIMGAIDPPTATPLPTRTPQPIATPVPDEPAEFSVPDEGAFHIEFPDTATYAHYPPSSGLHYGQYLDWGYYEDEVPPEYWVHSLEHGGIVVLYNCNLSPDCGAVEDAMTELFNTAPPDSVFNSIKILISPNSLIESPVVALAWTVQLNLDSADLEALTDFYVRHVNQGPELVP